MSNGAVLFETRINGVGGGGGNNPGALYDRAVNDRWRADTRSLLKRKWKLGRPRCVERRCIPRSGKQDSRYDFIRYFPFPSPAHDFNETFLNEAGSSCRHSPRVHFDSNSIRACPFRSLFVRYPLSCISILLLLLLLLSFSVCVSLFERRLSRRGRRREREREREDGEEEQAGSRRFTRFTHYRDPASILISHRWRSPSGLSICRSSNAPLELLHSGIRDVKSKLLFARVCSGKF